MHLADRCYTVQGFYANHRLLSFITHDTFLLHDIMAKASYYT